MGAKRVWPEKVEEGARQWAEPPRLAKLNAYCRRHIPDFQEFVAVVPIGQGYSNPTFRVETARGEFQVLRAMPRHRSVTSAHRIDREFRIISALQNSPVPVPRPIHYCADTSPAGSAFYLMEFVSGPVFVNGALPEDRAARRRILLDLADCLGRLHSLDHRTYGLAKFGSNSRSGFIERQVATMTKLYRASEMEHISEMEDLISLLQRFRPDSAETCIVHGDYRLGNVVVDPALCGIAAVLDWELSTIGDPLTDVAYCLLMYHWGSSLFGTVQGADGIPDETEFVDMYCRSSGRRSLPKLELYGAFSMFRLACITQAAIHRAEGGHALPRALAPEQYPSAIARAALDLVERRRQAKGG